MSVSPMVKPIAEPQPQEQEPEPEPEAEPHYRTVSRRRPTYRIFTLDGNNLAFVVLVIVEGTFAYAIGRLLGAW
jgi:hypothetical protein